MDNSPIGSFFRNKWVRLVLVIDALLLVAIIVIMIIGATKTSVLVLNIAPIDSEILLNGKKYENGSYSLNPGTYNIEISHEGLDSKSFSVKLESGHNLNVAAFLKSGDNDFSFYKLKGNYGSFTKLEEIASKGNNQTVDNDASAETFIAYFRKSYDALMDALPIEYQTYKNGKEGQELEKDVSIRMNQDEKCETYVCLKALMLGVDDRELIKSLMLEKGLKVEDYEIIYKTY